MTFISVGLESSTSDVLRIGFIEKREPGFGGQKFIESSLDKLKETARLRAEKGLYFDIEVDGGINFDNIKSICEAGANVIVAGSTVFKGDVSANVKRLMELM